MSTYVWKRNGICEGSGRKPRRSAARPCRLWPKRKPWRSEGVRPSSCVAGPCQYSSSESSDSSLARLAVSALSSSSFRWRTSVAARRHGAEQGTHTSSLTRDQKPLLTYLLRLDSSSTSLPNCSCTAAPFVWEAVSLAALAPPAAAAAAVPPGSIPLGPGSPESPSLLPLPPPPVSWRTRLSRLRRRSRTSPASAAGVAGGSLPATTSWPESGSGRCGCCCCWPSPARRRRAQRGGRSADGRTQAMSARRQLAHGDCLSQRTLRWRQTTQLRGFGGGCCRCRRLWRLGWW